MVITVILQSTFAFFAILIITRMLGKDQIAQLTYYEYINGITFGSIAANLATDDPEQAMGHTLGLISFGLLTYLMSYLSMKNRGLRKIVNGEPVILIQDGQILEDNLWKIKMDIDEFASCLRTKDVFDFNEVQFAILETTGKLSILRKSQFETPTRQDLNISSTETSMNIEVVADGQIFYHNLQRMGLNAKWLMNNLKKQGVSNVRDVFYATVDNEHTLYIDRYEDDIPGMVDISDGEKFPFSLDKKGQTYEQ